MILSVSRRTDIPNYYSEWFINRLKEGFVDVRNPMNAHQVSRIPLSPDVVDCIVFWTKNPSAMIGRLDELKNYHYYVQFTITCYGNDVERNIPDKKEIVIPAFQELARKIGAQRVIWRYDPILISEKYTIDYHLKAFRRIAEQLSGYTEKVVISFVDLYAKTRRNMKSLALIDTTDEEKLYIAGEIAKIAGRNGMTAESCAERIDLSSVGVRRGCCIDKALIEKITGGRLKGSKDKNQRPECGCFESIDIGSYDTCRNGCRYCYAVFGDDRAQKNAALYDPASSLLCGVLRADDKVTQRKVRSALDMSGTEQPVLALLIQ